MKLRELLLIVLIFISSHHLLAQSGPAGVQDGVAPGAVFWLRADQGITTTGSEVTLWADQLNGNDATSGNGPIISTGSINGFDALQFNGSDDNLTIANSTRINDGNSTNRTLFVTFQTGSALPGASDYQLIYEEGGGTNGLNIYLHDGEIVLYFWEGQNGGLDANQEYFATASAAVNTTYIAAIKYEGDGTTEGRVDFYLNDVSALSLGSPLAMPTANLDVFSSHTGDINLGGAPSAGDTQFVGDVASTGDYFDGLIAEMIYYDVTLDNAEFQVVYNYLSEKYGILLGSGDFYTEANYNNGVTGIGQVSGDQHLSSLGNGGGLYLEDDGGVNNDGEFIFAGHDNSNFSQTSGNVSVSGVDRYNRSWFVQKTGNVDGAKLIFNTTEVGLGAADDFGRVAGDYTLLYRSTTGGVFTDVGLSATIADDAGAGDGNNDVVFSLNDTQLQSGYYTLGVPENQTWYSYTTGNWNDPASWTLDGSATPLLLNPGNEIPDANDNVIITNGRTITMDVNNVVLQSAEVNGRLVLASTTGHNFNIIDGSGTIRMSGDGLGNANFPSGDTSGPNGFSNVDNGGTLELRGSGINLNQASSAAPFYQNTFNNIVVNLDATANDVVVLQDFTINGDLTVTRGTWQINNNSSTNALNIDLFGDLTISNSGEMRVGTANARHEFNFYGDFTNNGIAFFSQRASQVTNAEATDGIVDANFVAGNRDQRVDANNETYFYRIEIDKGVDATHTLFLETNAVSNFNLTGPVDYGLGGDVTTTNDNALGLIVGTVSIGTDVRINPLNNTGNYSIGSNARLLIAGGEVTKIGGAAITPYGTIEINAGVLEVPSGSGITTRATGQLIVSGGEVWLSQLRTSIFGSTAVGGYTQTGGTVNIWDYTAAESPITGLAAASASNAYARFCLTYEGNTFIMSGGTLNVKDATNSGLIFINSDPGNISVTEGTINAYSSVNNESEIASNAAFWDLNIIHEGGNAASRVTSETLTCGPGGADSRTITNPNLKVLNDLTIQTGTTRTSAGNTYGSYLDLCSDGTNCVNLEVGGDLRIEDSAVLDFFTDAADDNGSATLTFNGEGDVEFYIGDITSYDASLTDYDDPDGDGSYVDYRHPIYNLVIDKNGGTVRLAAKDPALVDGAGVLSSGGKNLDSNNARLLYISNGLTIASGSTLNQIDPVGGGIFGYIVRVYAPIINVDGNLLVYEQGVNPTNSFLEVREVDPDGIPGTDVGDVILINSTQGSTIGNLVVDLGNDELEIGSDLSVTRFVYRHGGVNIGTYNLKVDIFDFNTESNGDNERLRGGNGEYLLGENTSGARQYIYTAGNASDGGLSIKLPRITNEDGVNDEDNIGNDPSYDTENDEYQNNDLLWFPIGLADRYTPAVMYVVDDASVTYNDDEYITIRPVAGELQTTDLSGGDILQYYWRVGHEGFDGGLPNVSWLFQYDQDDVSGAENGYVPGKVLDGGSYQRSWDGSTQAVKNANTSGNGSTNDTNENHNILGGNPGNIIIFNGLNIGTTGTPGNVANDNIDGANNEVFNNEIIRPQWANAFPNAGFTLENANYTAGESDRFVGTPSIFYSRLDNFNTDWNNAASWNSEAELAADPSATDEHDPNIVQIAGGTAGTDFPGPGSIARLGINPVNGTPHSVRLNNNITYSAAEFIFAQNATITQAGRGGYSFLPELIVNTNNPTLNIGQIKGVGVITDRANRDPSYAGIDIADYANNPLSFYTIENFQDPGTYVNVPEVLPNLIITADGFGNNNRTAIISTDIRVAGDLVIAGDANLELNSDNGNPEDGDLLVEGNLLITGSYELFPGADIGTTNENAELRFPGSNGGVVPSRNVEVLGDVIINFAASDITITNSGVNNAEHNLIVHGNITDNSVNGGGGIDLNNNTDRVLLTLEGDNSVNLSSSNTNNGTFDLYTLEVNKTNLTNVVNVDTDIDLPLPSAIGQQPVEIVNGFLVLNDAGIDVTLTDESRGDFFLPNTANLNASSGSGGLEIAQGIVRVEGDDTGIILDGLLRISGGTLDMDDAVGNGNNFIEYSSSGNARIELSNGNLLVGSQVRRSLSSTTGVLQYSQSGGTASFGLNAAPEDNRGVFEILNTGSAFEYTGGTFNIVRDNNSTTVASLRLSPSSHNIGSGAVINVGTAETPNSDDDDFGIYATIPLDGLAIGQENSTIDPTAKIYGDALEVNNLFIGNDGNATFDAQGFNLIVNESFTNEGNFTASGNSVNQQTTFFPSNTASTLTSATGSGSSIFYNFVKDGIGVLTASKDFLVQNELRIEDGTLATGTQAINVEGDVVNLANHTSSNTPPLSDLYGIILSGTNRQNLEGIGGGVNNISNFGVLAINNPEGVLIQDGSEFTFEIRDRLIIEQGVLDISSNLFIFSEDAVVLNEDGNSSLNDFNVTNMIQTNSSFTDFGVRKRFTSGVQTDFVFPVGQQAYTPVEVDMTSALSGSSPTLTVRPANEPHPTVIDHDNSGGNSPGTLDDQSNVLQYHWILTSEGINSFTGNISMRYDPTDVSFLDPGDATASPLSFDTRNYAAARLLFSGTNWDKSFDGGSFNESNNLLIFSEASAFSSVDDNLITGDYTAGLLVEDDQTTPLDIGAIPNTVLEYETANVTGNFNTNTDWVGINGAPPLAAGETPNGSIIYVRNGDVMNFTTPNARIYRTVIESGGVLSIDENADNTRLGIVEGTGTLRIESNTVGQSPQLPAGFYGDFLTCSGGGLEYAGSVDYEVLANISQVREVIFSGSGDRELPNSNLLICDDFILRNSVSVTNSSSNQVSVQGDIIKSDGSNIDFGTGSIILNGSTTQQIAGDFRGVESFYNLEIDNVNGVTIVNSSADAINGISADVNGSVEISNSLTLTDGIVTTNNDNDLRMLFNSTINSPANGSTNTHIDGPFIRILDRDLTGSYKFPIGDNGRNGYMEIDAPDITAQDDWKVEYFNASPSSNANIDGIDGSFISSDASANGVQTASGNEYWAIEVNSAGNPRSNVNLSWDLTSDVQDETNLEMLFWDAASGTSWEQLSRVSITGNGSSGNLNAGPLTYSTKYVTFGSTDPNATPLPVEYTYFKAENEPYKVSLKWETATEIENDYFEIQRSADGEVFETIGFVEGNGDSRVAIQYSFDDYSPLNGDNYYRLKQVDFDEGFEYSEVVKVSRTIDSKLSVVPNPSTPSNVNLRLVGFNQDQDVQVVVYDVNGAIYYQGLHSVYELQNETLPLRQDMPSGVYIIKVAQGSQSKNVRLMIY